MITIKCASCQRKIFKYFKSGKGRIWRCYKARIQEDYSVRVDDEVLCQCGNKIGTDVGPLVKMRTGAFTPTGR